MGVGERDETWELAKVEVSMWLASDGGGQRLSGKTMGGRGEERERRNGFRSSTTTVTLSTLSCGSQSLWRDGRLRGGWRCLSPAITLTSLLTQIS